MAGVASAGNHADTDNDAGYDRQTGEMWIKMDWLRKRNTQGFGEPVVGFDRRFYVTGHDPPRAYSSDIDANLIAPAVYFAAKCYRPGDMPV